MKPRMKAISLGVVTLATFCISAQQPLQATIVYSNDFNSGTVSLNNYTIGGDVGPGSTYSVRVMNGQLQIDTTELGYPHSAWSAGYAAINNAAFGASYSSTLKSNVGLVTWAFNVSNQDSNWNNGFFVSLASSLPGTIFLPANSYVFRGGGMVGNRMVLTCNTDPPPDHDILVIPDGGGLDPLPKKGSFRITYDPLTDLWSVYGVFGLSYVDPTTVTNLLGSGVDSTITSIPLQYMCFGGEESGSDYYDNVSVGVIPEPTTVVLVGIGILTLWATSRRKH